MLEDIELDSIEPIKIPNLQDFRHLLRYSKLFQDYFNVFLNLPVLNNPVTISYGTHQHITSQFSSHFIKKGRSVCDSAGIQGH